jgi:glutamate synthase domain-containing protein 2
MIEIKMSQGAKPGHGGILPKHKVTQEIAETRGILMGEDCISPSRHSAFSTPIEMMQFIQQLRELSGGKPVGFKFCLGHPWEFMGIAKAMLETGILPDFIVVDGKEGGTGAAPVEFTDHIGVPMREGLLFVHNTLVGLNLRDKIKLGASGKIVSAFDIASVLAIGADWANSARGFMFAIGCIQSQSCHTNKCPTGVATQDPCANARWWCRTRPSAFTTSTATPSRPGRDARRRGPRTSVAVVGQAPGAAHVGDRDQTVLAVACVPETGGIAQR